VGSGLLWMGDSRAILRIAAQARVYDRVEGGKGRLDLCEVDSWAGWLTKDVSIRECALVVRVRFDVLGFRLALRLIYSGLSVRSCNIVVSIQGLGAIVVYRFSCASRHEGVLRSRIFSSFDKRLGLW